jgi:hypothetical protein
VVRQVCGWFDRATAVHHYSLNHSLQRHGTVKAAAQAVAFRKQPVVNDTTLIRWLPLGEELTINEPGGESKVGANNQWLKVRDRSGTEGYVAAWFVSR